MLLNVTFCAETATIWQFVGNLLLVFKVIIPVIIIILGIIDLGKAVIASNEDEIKKASTSLLKRFIAGVVIFFIPTLVGVLFGLVGSFKTEDGMQKDFNICKSCISSPNSTACTGAVKAAK